jgi:hypothetical protein
MIFNCDTCLCSNLSRRVGAIPAVADGLSGTLPFELYPVADLM